MKTYKKIHESKEVANIHIAKIKSNGGTVRKVYLGNGNIELTYYFDADVKDFKKVILKAVSEHKKITVNRKEFKSFFSASKKVNLYLMNDIYNVDKWDEYNSEKEYIKAIMQQINYYRRKGFPDVTEIS